MGYKTDKYGIPSSPVLPTKMSVPTGAPIAASETKNVVDNGNLGPDNGSPLRYLFFQLISGSQ